MTAEKVSICITTRDRTEAFYKTYHRIMMTLPPYAKAFVVNDAGEPTLYDTFRFPERVGIPRAKNKCLELAMEWGAEHIFLFDDDCYPILGGWELPYICSPYPHLCFTFLPPYTTESGHKYHHLGNGCMMYVHRSVVDRIGGFDTAFGIGKYEHAHFSHRACAAGLIPSPFIDVEGSSDLLYSMDASGEVERTLTKEEMVRQLHAGEAHFYDTKDRREFVGYW